MKLPIILQVLRSEADHVPIFGGIGHTPKPVVHIVIVLKERATSAVRQNREDIALRRCGLHLKLSARSNAKTISPYWVIGMSCLTCVAAWDDDVKSARVQRADNHLRAKRTVDQTVVVV